MDRKQEGSVTKADERRTLFMSLRQELLGPRGGPWEGLPIHPESGNPLDPAQEYLTGVLDPEDLSGGTHNPDGDSSGLGVSEPAPETAAPEPAINHGDEDQEPEEDVAEPPPGATVNLTLDGRRRPRSVGLSFVVSSPSVPKVEVVATYGTYERGPSGWQREPHHIHVGPIDVTQPGPWVSGSSSAALVELHLRAQHVGPGQVWRISAFLVNVTVMPKGTPYHERSGYRVFQPEIRIVLSPPAELAPLGSPNASGGTTTGSVGQDYFADRGAYARGHLCGSVWQSVDYFGDAPDPDWSQRGWPDGEAVEPTLTSRFRIPTVRTDYLPAYHVAAPNLE